MALSATSEVLASAGFTVRTFTSARHALEVVPALAFDAVVTEYRLAELGAAELRARVHERLRTLAPGLVVVTRALHSMPIPERSLFTAVLPKPADRDALVLAVGRAAAKRAAAFAIS